MDFQNDKDLQRKLGIESLLSSSGFPILERELFELETCIEDSIAQQCKTSVSVNDLGVFNYDLGRKAGLAMALNILEQLREEVRDTSLTKR